MVLVSEGFDASLRKAFRGGIAGMGAQVANILPLMWMRTIMEYQYNHGGGMIEVMRKLYAEGGVPRFYRGIAPALVLAPLSRFGDTAANELALASLQGRNLPIAVQTLFASGTAALFRLVILPFDAWKTTKQVRGKEGLQRLIAKTRKHPTALWHGAVSVFAAASVGHYPFFYTNNQLREVLPQFEFRFGNHVRNALIGFSSAVVSDVTANPIRVLKVVRQTSLTPISYAEAVRSIVAEEGWTGLWSRGLRTRILANGIQGSLFMVLWKALSESLDRRL